MEDLIDKIAMFLKEIFCKETSDQTYKRLFNLTDKQDIPSMKAQDALSELCNHFLGVDWYVVDPLGVEQINTEIVYNIEIKYPKYRHKEGE